MPSHHQTDYEQENLDDFLDNRVERVGEDALKRNSSLFDGRDDTAKTSLR